ncbi:hypothetical protein LCGC14_0797260 [marine sediment metagenome]|uniref:GGDEF domain-containing protein n=1 Tax=marine sediment metagenome TaxID=412755 RepID=A0A0F9PV63_9ZZZZ
MQKHSWMNDIKQYFLASLVSVLLMPYQAEANALQLLADEEQYLSTINEIRLCTDPDWLPYEAIDKDGSYTGIMSDFHKLWAGMIGKPIVLMPTSSWDEALTLIKNKQCDVLSSAQDIPSRQHFLSVTDPFIDYPLAIATHPDALFITDLSQVADRVFVMVSGYAAADIIKAKYPKLHLVLVDNSEKGLKMVEKGEAFAFIDTVPSINYQMLTHGISHLKISGVLNKHYSMSVGIRKDLPELLSIYNKAIAATSEQQRQNILNKWLSITFEYDFNYQLLWKILAGLFVLISFILYRARVIHRHNADLKEVNKRLFHMSNNDQLTGLSNRYFLHEKFTRLLQTFQTDEKVFSVIMTDIDHFIKVNDTYGHIVGDEVIKRVATLLKTHLRGDDVVGRWGGEEFLIICPSTEAKDAENVAEGLRYLIDEYDFSLPDLAVTASFGIAEIRIGEQVEDCVKRADMALYLAKESGRNRTVVF